MTLSWTHTVPTVPGWYWAIHAEGVDEGDLPEMWHLYRMHNGDERLYVDEYGYLDESWANWWWCGPIPPPPPVKEPK